MKKTGLWILAVFLWITPGWTQWKAIQKIHEGNKAYEQKKYANAEVEYSKARKMAKNPVIPDYNLGTSLYKQKKYDKAADQFLSVVKRSQGDKEKAKALYNLGNTLLQSKKLDESIKAYKMALKYNPDDMDAKYNLLYAMKLKQQQQQQQQKNKNNKNQNQNQNDKDQQQKKKNQQQKNQQNKQQQQQQKKQQQQQENQQNQNRQQQQKPQPGKISKKDAERILRALAEDEKKVQEKVILMPLYGTCHRKDASGWSHTKRVREV